MKKKYMRTVTALLITVVLGSPFLTGCSTKKATSTGTDNPSITQEPTIEATVAPAKQEISVTFDTIKDDIKDDKNSEITLINVTYNQPTVTIPNNEAASKKINEFFAARNDTLRAQIQEDYKGAAKDSYQVYVDNNWDDWYENEVECCYSLERSDETCISFSYSFYYDFHGPHPNSELFGYTFDSSTGELLKLEDIAENMDEFKKQVNEKILEECEQIKKIQGDDSFPEGYETEVPKILQDDTWFFDDKGFEVIANEFTIAPHVLGVFNTLIPYPELNGVKEEFIKK